MSLEPQLERPLVLVTCGPGVSPIDEVRQITNFSTGELGVLLTEKLLGQGFDVLCFKSRAATYRNPLSPQSQHRRADTGTGTLRLVPFTTNDSLLQALSECPGRGAVRCVFHAAALNDYQIDSLRSPEEGEIRGRKISSSHSRLILELVPAPKLLPLLPGLFPSAQVVGWKYELDGTRDAALRKGFEQLEKNKTSLCVVNGRAVGGGFCIVGGEDPLVEHADKTGLCEWLAEWARHRVATPAADGAG